MTWQDKLQANITLFDGKKSMWLPEELALAYEIWNGAHSAQFGRRVDTGCSSCRRTIVQGVVKLAQQYVK
jgi:hypothetical protein